MITRKGIRLNLKQIFAIAEKNIKVTLRFRLSLIMNYVTPILQILLPMIILNRFFSLKAEFGAWTNQTYLLFLFLGYNILLVQKIIGIIPAQFRTEKFWDTLSALMIAPFRRQNLLFGIVISHFSLILIPFCVFFIFCYIFYPVSFLTSLCIIGIYMAILIIFAGAGLIIGVFFISKESIGRIMITGVNIIFWFSCITYPYDIFPGIIQSIITINPVYYLIDTLRLTWVENDLLLTITTHPLHFLNLMSLLIAFPVIGIYMFNYIFKKYGIEGY